VSGRLKTDKEATQDRRRATRSMIDHMRELAEIRHLA